MTPPHREEGISEAVGFILLLAVIIVTISIYLLYLMPAMGRENEIAQMSAVKERFTEYKLNIDTLWTSRQCTSEFGPALSLGSGDTAGILSYFPFFSPSKAGAILALNQRAENITITSDSYVLVSSGGYSESQAITNTPSNLKVNTTPQHFYINISTSDLLTERGVLINGTAWGAWVNITPNYFSTTMFNMTLSGGKPTNFWNWTENQWNSTDITVNTYSRGSILVSNLPVYRNVTTSTVYTVDLMSPVYGISTQFQSPQSVSASTSDNTGKITASYDVRYGYVPMISTSTQPLGAIEYRSNNLYYTPQTYYYQLGGVFLEQPDGSTNEIPPAISISMMGSSPVVNVGEILILGGVTSTQVSGSGPISITSAVTDLSSAPLPAGNNTRWVNLSIQAASTNASEMWNRTFQDLANRGGLPVTSYTTGRSGNVAFLYITGNSQTYDVRLSLTRVNVSADYVEEYSTGGISRSWRNVPGFEAPTNTTTGTTTAPTTTTSTVTPTPTPTPIGGGPFWLNSTTVSGGYKLITTKPLGSSASGTSNTKFYSDAFSGGEVLNAGTTNVYLWMQTSPASPFNITWDYGSGGTWTTLGRYKGAFAAAGSPWLFTIPFGTDGHTFAAGEQLRLNLTYDFGSSPNGVYWDGVYNDSRVETPSSPCVPTFVQAASNSSYGPNVVITLPGPSTWGDLIIVSFDVQRNGGSPGILTKVDTKGNTYSSAASTDWNGTFYRAWTDYATNIIGGGPITINITLSTNTGSSYTHAAEYSCVASVTPLDQIRSNTGTGGLTLYSGPRTTTQASELIFGYGVSEGTCSVDTPYTARDTAFGSFIADQTVSSIGSYNVTGSMSYAQQWGCQMVTFIGR